jgi:uncharacterized protein YegP (UPF0339 family)
MQNGVVAVVRIRASPVPLIQGEHEGGYEPAFFRQTPDGEWTMEYCTYQDNKSEWRWRLKAKNGEIIADSGEGYKNKSDCLAGIKLVQGSASAPVKDC